MNTEIGNVAQICNTSTARLKQKKEVLESQLQKVNEALSYFGRKSRITKSCRCNYPCRKLLNNLSCRTLKLNCPSGVIHTKEISVSNDDITLAH